MPPTKKLTISVSEAAELIGISRAQAYRCVKARQLRAVRLGRRIVIPVAAVEESLATPYVDDLALSCLPPSADMPGQEPQRPKLGS